MPMIAPTVVQAVQQLLQERGIEQREGERLGDYIARGLGISDSEADRLVEALHEGCTVAEAARRAGVSPTAAQQNLLTEIARVIGAALAKV